MGVLNLIFTTLINHHGLFSAYKLPYGSSLSNHPKVPCFSNTGPLFSNDTEPDEPEPNLVIVVLFFGLFFGYVVVSALITYTILDVVATLAMIEDGRPSYTPGEADEPLFAAQTQPQTPNSTCPLPDTSGPITSGIRRTLAYLQAEAGAYSSVRGLGYAIVYFLAEILLTVLFLFLFRPILWAFADLLVPVWVALLIWRFNNAWLHKVIAKPAQKSWPMRVAEQRRTWPVIQAIALWSFCRTLSAFVTQALLEWFVISKFHQVGDKIKFDDNASPRDTALEFLGIYALSLVQFLVLVLPATVVLVRVQAAQLPEGEDAVVPFDKTVGGRVVLETPEGEGMQLPLMAAWRSFSRPSWVRLLKTYVKNFVIQVALVAVVFFMFIVVAIVCQLPGKNKGVHTIFICE